MKLLLDQGLPRSTTILLAKFDIEAVHVGQIGMSTAEDVEILKVAETNEQVVVTLDSDFHTILALENSRQPSVIRIRIQGLKAAQLCDLLLKVLQACTEDLERGAAVTVEENRIRVRNLPLIEK